MISMPHDRPESLAKAFIALRPSGKLYEFIKGCKAETVNQVGAQKFVTDPPHTTLFVGIFLRERLGSFMDELGAFAKSARTVNSTVRGWRVFESDPMTSGNTLVIEFADESQARFRETQATVLRLSKSSLDLTATRQSLQPRWGLLSDEQKASATRCGFPYTGAGWIPHVTVASFERKAWDTFGAKLRNHTPPPSAQFGAIDLFEIDSVSGEPSLLGEFQLGGQA